MPGANPDFASRVYPARGPIRISTTKIREFARATGLTHPVSHSEQAAKEAGYASLVAPPTFLVAAAQETEAQYINDPEAGVDFSRVVHSEESFRLERPIVAGDELYATLTVVSVKAVGPHSMVSTRVDFESEGAPVAQVTSSLVIRGEEEK